MFDDLSPSHQHPSDLSAPGASDGARLARANSQQVSLPTPPGAERETTRLEAFSDGVFAIAVTLLVLELPTLPFQPNQDLAALLTQHIGAFAAYVVSFAVILIMWANHHDVFTLIHHVDRTFMMINGFLLLVITFLDYPTLLLGEYLGHAGSDASVAMVLYSGTGIFIAGGYQLLWYYARHNRFLRVDADLEAVRRIDVGFRAGTLYLVTFVLAFFPPLVPLSLALTAFLALFFAFFTPGHRHEHPHA